MRKTHDFDPFTQRLRKVAHDLAKIMASTNVVALAAKTISNVWRYMTISYIVALLVCCSIIYALRWRKFLAPIKESPRYLMEMNKERVE